MTHVDPLLSLTSAPECTVWYARWQALDHQIETLINQIDEKSTTQWAADFRVLVNGLRDFTRNHFKFFFYGFFQKKIRPKSDDGHPYTPLENGSKSPIWRLYEIATKGILHRDHAARSYLHLENHLEFPPEFVLRRIIDQASHDLGVIEMAWYQRVSSEINLATLTKADALAQSALGPVTHQYGEDNSISLRRLLPKTRVITYFQKSAEVRVIPYASVALVGLPRSTRLSDHFGLDIPLHLSVRGLLAVGHELGHYLFWHGRLKSEASEEERLPIYLRHQIKAMPDWVQNWLEEIFADVFGTLVVGPAAVFAAQEVQRQRPTSVFTIDDQHYPVGSVRPSISWYTLSKMHELDGDLRERHFENARELLHSRWQKELEKRGKPQRLYVHTRSRDESSPRQRQVERQIEKLVDVILEMFQKASYRMSPEELWTTQSVDEADYDSVDDIMADFAEFVQQFKEGSVNIPPVQPQHALMSWNSIFVTHDWPTSLQTPEQSLPNLPVDFWLPIFKSEGWATEGPDTQPVIEGD